MARVRKKRKQENGVTWGMLLFMFFSVALVLLLTIPNIYLDNQIYKESREIARYQRIVTTLQEEQAIIKNRLEKIRYHEHLQEQPSE